MEIVKITSKIIHINFPTQKLLNKTFVRFSEYQESPKFKDTIFTLKEFKKYYAEVHKGFTYYSDWDGHNISSKVLNPFRMGLFTRLSKEEKEFLKLFSSYKEPFYIIGTFGKNNSDTLKHEIAHGLFYTDQIYRNKVTGILKNKNLKEVHKYLKKLGYHRSVWLDEAHAYILSNSEDLIKEKIKFPNITKQLNREFKKALQRCRARGT